MEGKQLIHRHIADTIAVREHERLIVHIGRDALDASARHRIESCVDHRDLPRLRMLLMNHNFVPLRKVKRYIGRMQEIISKVLLDDMLLVARTNDEFIESKMCVFLHDMPKNRHTANLDHRFRRKQDSSLIRVPNPPANRTTFMLYPPCILNA